MTDAADHLGAGEHQTFCRLCGAHCGVVVRVEGDTVVDVRGDRAHPTSRGYTCPKGRALAALHHHPARLDQPLRRRVGAAARPVTWDEQLSDLAAGLRAAIAAVGPDGVAVYVGTAGTIDSAASTLVGPFLAGLGSRSWYSTLTVDCPSATLVAELMTGHPLLVPVPDTEARLTLLIGSNPMLSHGHTCFMTRPKEQLRRWASAGALWVVDPRRTETADVATRHLAPRPGSDHILLAHLVRELLRDGADREELLALGADVAVVAAAVEPFTLARAARETGLAAADLVDLAAAMRRAGRVAVLSGTGATFAADGNVVMWLTWVLNAITGSLDRPGGMWFNPGYLRRLDTQSWEPTDAVPASGPASRPELPGRLGQWPCAALCDEIEQGNVRALIVLGGNPLIAFPDADRTAAALARLDVLAVAETVDNELAALATHVLPATAQLERADVIGVYEVFNMEQVGQLTGAVVAPAAARRPVWWMLAQLARRLGYAILPDGLDPDRATDEDVLAAVYGADRDRWEALRAAPTGVVAAERRFGWVRDALPGGRFRLAPRELVAQLEAAVAPDPSALVVVSRRQRRKVNSQMADGHGPPTPDVPEALLHPADAAAIGLDGPGTVVLESRHGALRIVARPDERMVRRGVVSVPHGFTGANVGALTSAHEDVDGLTGMVLQTGVAVTVTLADHPLGTR